eukprot:4208111-Pleurochrysis_carterae.AAC.1
MTVEPCPCEAYKEVMRGPYTGELGALGQKESLCTNAQSPVLQLKRVPVLSSVGDAELNEAPATALEPPVSATAYNTVPVAGSVATHRISTCSSTSRYDL